MVTACLSSEGGRVIGFAEKQHAAVMPIWSTILQLSYSCRCHAVLRLLGVVQDEIQRLGPSVEALTNDGVMEAILTQVTDADSQTLTACVFTPKY